MTTKEKLMKDGKEISHQDLNRAREMEVSNKPQKDGEIPADGTTRTREQDTGKATQAEFGKSADHRNDVKNKADRDLNDGRDPVTGIKEVDKPNRDVKNETDHPRTGPDYGSSSSKEQEKGRQVVADKEKNSPKRDKKPAFVSDVKTKGVGSIDLSSVDPQALSAPLRVNGSNIPVAGRTTPQGVVAACNTMSRFNGVKASLDGDNHLVLESIDGQVPLEDSLNEYDEYVKQSMVQPGDEGTLPFAQRSQRA